MQVVIFFSGVPLLECRRVDDTSPENTIVGLPGGGGGDLFSKVVLG